MMHESRMHMPAVGLKQPFLQTKNRHDAGLMSGKSKKRKDPPPDAKAQTITSMFGKSGAEKKSPAKTSSAASSASPAKTPPSSSNAGAAPKTASPAELKSPAKSASKNAIPKSKGSDGKLARPAAAKPAAKPAAELADKKPAKTDARPPKAAAESAETKESKSAAVAAAASVKAATTHGPAAFGSPTAAAPAAAAKKKAQLTVPKKPASESKSRSEENIKQGASGWVRDCLDHTKQTSVTASAGLIGALIEHNLTSTEKDARLLLAEMYLAPATQCKHAGTSTASGSSGSGSSSARSALSSAASAAASAASTAPLLFGHGSSAPTAAHARRARAVLALLARAHAKLQQVECAGLLAASGGNGSATAAAASASGSSPSAAASRGAGSGSGASKRGKSAKSAGAAGAAGAASSAMDTAADDGEADLEDDGSPPASAASAASDDASSSQRETRSSQKSQLSQAVELSQKDQAQRESRIKETAMHRINFEAFSRQLVMLIDDAHTHAVGASAAAATAVAAASRHSAPAAADPPSSQLSQSSARSAASASSSSASLSPPLSQPLSQHSPSQQQQQSQSAAAAAAATAVQCDWLQRPHCHEFVAFLGSAVVGSRFLPTPPEYKAMLARIAVESLARLWSPPPLSTGVHAASSGTPATMHNRRVLRAIIGLLNLIISTSYPLDDLDNELVKGLRALPTLQHQLFAFNCILHAKQRLRSIVNYTYREALQQPVPVDSILLAAQDDSDLHGYLKAATEQAEAMAAAFSNKLKTTLKKTQLDLTDLATDSLQLDVDMKARTVPVQTKITTHISPTKKAAARAKSAHEREEIKERALGLKDREEAVRDEAWRREVHNRRLAGALLRAFANTGAQLLLWRQQRGAAGDSAAGAGDSSPAGSQDADGGERPAKRRKVTAAAAGNGKAGQKKAQLQKQADADELLARLSAAADGAEKQLREFLESGKARV